MIDSIRLHNLPFALIVILSLLTFETAYAKKKSGRELHKLGGFEVNIEEVNDSWNIGKTYRTALSRSKENIFEEQSYMMAPEVKYLKGIPAKGCDAMIVWLYSGGAHCCFTAILCTACGPKETAVILDLSDSKDLNFIDANGDGTKEIAYLDMQFSYYDPDISSLDLSFSTSPAMLRLLVFDQNRWRPDKPGEYKKYYLDLLPKSKNKAAQYLSRRIGKKASATEDEPAASAAMEAAYYALMACEPEENVKELLKKLLPARWQEAKEKVFSDIKQNLHEANPVIQQFVK